MVVVTELFPIALEFIIGVERINNAFWSWNVSLCVMWNMHGVPLSAILYCKCHLNSWNTERQITWSCLYLHFRNMQLRPASHFLQVRSYPYQPALDCIQWIFIESSQNESKYLLVHATKQHMPAEIHWDCHASCFYLNAFFSTLFWGKMPPPPIPVNNIENFEKKMLIPHIIYWYSQIVANTEKQNTLHFPSFCWNSDC